MPEVGSVQFDPVEKRYFAKPRNEIRESSSHAFVTQFDYSGGNRFREVCRNGGADGFISMTYKDQRSLGTLAFDPGRIARGCTPLDHLLSANEYQRQAMIYRRPPPTLAWDQSSPALLESPPMMAFFALQRNYDLSEYNESNNNSSTSNQSFTLDAPLHFGYFCPGYSFLPKIQSPPVVVRLDVQNSESRRFALIHWEWTTKWWYVRNLMHYLSIRLSQWFISEQIILETLLKVIIAYYYYYLEWQLEERRRKRDREKK